MTHLSLFSGIGGLDLAAEWAGFETVGQCEFADYPYRVLCKHWPDMPKWRDVRDVTAESFRERTGIERPTVVSGGFPCQPHSVAGKRLASDDERDLWGELFRIYRDTNARWLVAENVGGLLSSEDGRFFGRILRDLAGIGCNVWWHSFPAYAVGAVYSRERVSIVACADCNRLQRFIPGHTKTEAAHTIQRPPNPALRDVLGLWNGEERYTDRIRDHDGLPGWMDRLKCLGNAVVPQQFYPVFKAIADIEEREVASL